MQIPLALRETLQFALAAVLGLPFEVFEEDEKDFYKCGSVCLPLARKVEVVVAAVLLALFVELLRDELHCVDGFLVVHAWR